MFVCACKHLPLPLAKAEIGRVLIMACRNPHPNDLLLAELHIFQ